VDTVSEEKSKTNIKALFVGKEYKTTNLIYKE